MREREGGRVGGREGRERERGGREGGREGREREREERERAKRQTKRQTSRQKGSTSVWSVKTVTVSRSTNIRTDLVVSTGAPTVSPQVRRMMERATGLLLRLRPWEQALEPWEYSTTTVPSAVAKKGPHYHPFQSPYAFTVHTSRYNFCNGYAARQTTNLLWYWRWYSFLCLAKACSVCTEHLWGLDSCFYIALFPALEQTLRFCHTGFQMSDCCFLQRVLSINRSGV